MIFPKPIAILGAGGHGCVIGTALAEIGSAHVYLDDHAPIDGIEGSIRLSDPEFLRNRQVIIGIGDCRIRHGFSALVERNGGKLYTFIHRSAVVNPISEIGAGTAIMANAVVGPYNKIGKACVINICASVAHDCVIGDGSQIADGARLGGGIVVGEDTLIGMGAVILPKIRIGSNVVVGAGSVVTKDIPDGETRYGNPARCK